MIPLLDVERDASRELLSGFNTGGSHPSKLPLSNSRLFYSTHYKETNGVTIQVSLRLHLVMTPHVSKKDHFNSIYSRCKNWICHLLNILQDQQSSSVLMSNVFAGLSAISISRPIVQSRAHHISCNCNESHLQIHHYRCL